MPRARSRRSISSNIIFFTNSCSSRSNLSAICFNGSGARCCSFLLPPARRSSAYLLCSKPQFNQRKSLSKFTTEGLYAWRRANEGAPITIWQRSEVPRLGNQGDKPLAFILPCSVNSWKGREIQQEGGTVQFMFASGFEQEKYQPTSYACSHIYPTTLHPGHEKNEFEKEGQQHCVNVTPCARIWGSLLVQLSNSMGSNPAFSAKETRNWCRFSRTSQCPTGSFFRRKIIQQ